MAKVRLATIWLDGCSGCHMSILDMDEHLIELADRIDLVYGPYVDIKEFPDNVDVTLVEGAVSTTEDLEKIQNVRTKTNILVSLGDCAITANVPAMRNPFPVEEVLAHSYQDTNVPDQAIPNGQVPSLLPQSRPVHEFVKVDVFIPGCPPHADVIAYALDELLQGRMPELSEMTRFGQ